VKPIWILLKQETVSGSGISWTICSRQITTPAPHHSSFLQARCPSCRPTNSVKAPKALQYNNSVNLPYVVDADLAAELAEHLILDAVHLLLQLLQSRSTLRHPRVDSFNPRLSTHKHRFSSLLFCTLAVLNLGVTEYRLPFLLGNCDGLKLP